MSPRASRVPASEPRASSSRASGGRIKGRYWVMLWLALFLATAAVVQYRQSRAVAAVRELRSLETARAALEVSKANLAGKIHIDKSRAVLVPLAQRRLGLRLPLDSEVVIIQAPPVAPERPR